MLAQMVHDSLISSGKSSMITIYPSYDSNGDMIINGADDGHALFFEVQPPYWPDVLNFLNSNSCGTTGIKNAAGSASSLNIYPHPLKDKTTVQFNNPKQENHTLTLYDLQGRPVKTITNITAGRVTIRKEDLANGLYLFQISTDRIGRFSGKLTIQ